MTPDTDPNKLDRELHSKYLVLAGYMAAIEHPITIVEGWRPPGRQAEIIANNPEATNAKPGESLHEVCDSTGRPAARAVDLIFIGAGGKRTYTGPWRVLGAIAQWIGLRWGGDWDGDGDESDQRRHDNGHVELMG